MKQCFMKYWKAHDHHEECYRYIYEWIVYFKCKGQLPDDMFTEEHYKEVWQDLTPIWKSPAAIA